GHIRVVIHGPENPENPLPAPQLYWGDAPIRILDEATGEDLATLWYQAAAAFANIATPLDSPWSNWLYVGSPNAQHSGEAQCVLRYSLAETYPRRGDPSTYYSVPAGTEPAGLEICSTGKGTGGNDAGRKPQAP